MQQFPELEENQVVLMRAEFNTGHIVDETFNLVKNDSQIVYTIFNEIDTALAFAKKIIDNNKLIECVLYDKNKGVIKYITPKE